MGMPVCGSMECLVTRSLKLEVQDSSPVSPAGLLSNLAVALDPLRRANMSRVC